MKHIGEYVIVDQNISKGAFATIHKGYHKYTNQPVAIKELRVNNVTHLKPYVIRELKIHKKLSHPNIVKLYDIITNTNDNIIYLIMEYCEYGDLQKFQKTRPLTEKYIQCYMLQLRDALKYLVENNIVHRDLKPQNILLSDPTTIKITDFGLARQIETDTPLHSNKTTEYPEVEEDLFSTYCGSPMYMSPEVLNKNNYGSKSDLWSVGIILYEMITGHTPYKAKNVDQLKRMINEPINLESINKDVVSFACYDLLVKLLNREKTNRISWNEFFCHEWFSRNMFLEYENKLIECPLDNDLLKLQEPIFRTEPIISRSNSISGSNLKFSSKLKINKLLIDDNIETKYESVILTPEKLQPPIETNNFLQPNSPKCERTEITERTERTDKKHSKLLSQFTFTLKSSQFSDDSRNGSDIQQEINLSDLKQDDLPSYQNIQLSKPIDIVRNNSYNRPRQISSSSSSNTPGSANMNNIGFSTKSLNQAVTHSFKFLKETYDYLNSDNKSI
jgi:serine/threonine protein kinase